MLPGSREGQNVLPERPEFDGLAADRQLTVCGLDGSEVRLPLEDNMTVEGLAKSVAGRIGLPPLGSPLGEWVCKEILVVNMFKEDEGL